VHLFVFLLELQFHSSHILEKEEATGKQYIGSKSKQLKDGVLESGTSLFRKSKNLSTTLARKSDVKKEKEGS
jgi:hypothetical protein